MLALLGRSGSLFAADLERHGRELRERVAGGRFLVVGGAGSIGQAVVKEIFKRGPRLLHVMDLSENNLVELVRDLRSSVGYIEGEFRTFAIDFGSLESDALLRSVEGYDYLLNLSALKHVRSERDPFTLMRLIETNIVHTERLRRSAMRMNGGGGVRKLFCVSTDKATNPVNLMGCSKRVMELMLFAGSRDVSVSTARFANVAFSDGSLLHGFNQRFAKSQPLSAPLDVRRYFLTSEEAGVLCLASCLMGGNREIFFPKLDPSSHLITFADIAVRYLESLGYEPVRCGSEDEARSRVTELRTRRQWPVYFFSSDTSGEKQFEEFYTPDCDLDLGRYADIGVIRNPLPESNGPLSSFLAEVARLRKQGSWTKQDLVDLMQSVVPEFHHLETGKNLDERM